MYNTVMVSRKSINQSGVTLAVLVAAMLGIALVAFIGVAYVSRSVNSIAESRDTSRLVDIKLIRTVVEQGLLEDPSRIDLIPKAATCALPNQEIARSYNHSTEYLQLPLIVSDGRFLESIPTDPISSSADGTGYYMFQNQETKRVTVCAPAAELKKTISVTI